MNDETKDPLATWHRVNADTIMGPLIGDRPEDDVFTGALTGRMIHAIADDAQQALAQSLEADPDGEMSIKDLMDQVAIRAAVQASRRIALEFKGCTIDPDYTREP